MFKNPIFLMLTSILLYSLFPLVGFFGTNNLSGLTFAGLSHLLSAIVSITGAIFLSRKLNGYKLQPLVQKFRQDSKAIRQAALSGFINYLSHAFLFMSFAYISKTSATVMFEAWPVLAVFFLAATSRSSNTTQKRLVEPRTYLLSTVAFLGLIILMMGDPQTSTENKNLFNNLIQSSDAQIGLLFAFFSAIFMAYSVALGRNTRVFVEEAFGTCESGMAQLNRALIASSATKIFGALGFFLTMPFIPNVFSSISTMNSESWLWVVFSGVVIVTLGSLTYREALARTNRSELVILWYTTPIFALLWLWLAGGEQMTIETIIGALLIVSANILLQFRALTLPVLFGALLFSIGLFFFFN